jgi:hypothetical protein
MTEPGSSEPEPPRPAELGDEEGTIPQSALAVLQQIEAVANDALARVDVIERRIQEREQDLLVHLQDLRNRSFSPAPEDPSDVRPDSTNHGPPPAVVTDETSEPPVPDTQPGRPVENPTAAQQRRQAWVASAIVAAAGVAFVAVLLLLINVL